MQIIFVIRIFVLLLFFFSGRASTAQLKHLAGSGVFINNRGDILTAAHVVDDSIADTITIETQDGMRQRATIVYVDRATDSAVLHVDMPHYSHYGVVPMVWEGDDVMSVGYKPLEYGRPSNFKLFQSSWAKVTEHSGHLIYTSTYTCQGMSGGPLINRSNRILGELSIGLHESAHCSYGSGYGDISKIVPLFDEYDIPFDYTQNGDYRDIVLIVSEAK